MGYHLKEEELEEEKGDPYTIEKVFGVATLGAVTSLGLYFLYHNLSEETRKTVKDSLISGFKAALHMRD